MARAVDAGHRARTSRPARGGGWSALPYRSRRRWQDERFIEVLRKVREAALRLPIVVIGLPREWDRVKMVAESVAAVGRLVSQYGLGGGNRAMSRL